MSVGTPGGRLPRKDTGEVRPGRKHPFQGKAHHHGGLPLWVGLHPPFDPLNMVPVDVHYSTAKQAVPPVFELRVGSVGHVPENRQDVRVLSL